MKTLGLIGGISWLSTVEYYTLINQYVNKRLGGHNSAQCIIYSFNFAELLNSKKGNWENIFKNLVLASNHLKESGAECIVLCANTIHVLAEQLERTINIPVIHVARETALAIANYPLKKVGLIGTKETMEMSFFKSKLIEKNIEVLVPPKVDRAYIAGTILDELTQGILRKDTKKRYLTIINQLIDQGAEGIILGCTEIALLIQQNEVACPVFNTMTIHAAAAVNFSIE